DIYVMDAEGGKPRRLTDETSDEDAPTWSQDGLWIYFFSNRSGSWQVWKIPAEGGAALQVTKRGGGKCLESTDSKFVYYSEYKGAGIYRVPVEGGEETLVIDSYKAGWGNFAVVEDGIYFIKQDSSGGEAAIKFFNFATQQVGDVVALGKIN